MKPDRPAEPSQHRLVGSGGRNLRNEMEHAHRESALLFRPGSEPSTPTDIAGAVSYPHPAPTGREKHYVGQPRPLWRNKHTRAGEQFSLFPPGKIFGFDNFEIPMPQDL